MLKLVFKGFRKPSEKHFKEAEAFEDKIHQYSSDLTKFIISRKPSNKKEKDWAKPYLSIASSLDRMTNNIESISDRVRGKSENHILFSDQAVKEVDNVFREAMGLLAKLSSLITTQDKLLAQQIGERGRAILKIADGYSEGHEERLIQGICVPTHSPTYLGIVESLKGVIIHTLEVSGKIFYLSSKT
jgi:Na+/phosphate symporter